MFEKERKPGGWKTTFLLGFGLFSGSMLNFGGVNVFFENLKSKYFLEIQLALELQAPTKETSVEKFTRAGEGGELTMMPFQQENELS